MKEYRQISSNNERKRIRIKESSPAVMTLDACQGADTRTRLCLDAHLFARVHATHHTQLTSVLLAYFYDLSRRQTNVRCRQSLESLPHWLTLSLGEL